MGSSAIPAAVIVRDPEALRAALVSELVPVIASNVDPQTWDPRELPGVGGNTWQAVIWQERLWFRDEDSLVDHDELTCIRLLDGVAYLTNDVKFPGFVLSRTLATPPDEEDRVYGDTYRVPAGGTDEWAGHEDEDAMWTARGYRFRDPVTGDLHYVVDEAGYEHFSAEDEWEDGFGALVFENGSVRPNSLLIRSWAVENQTTNTLSSTGPAGEQYIVGSTPTGAAVGQAKKIAWRPATDAAFIFTTPFTGELVYDKALGYDVRWSSSLWQSAAGVWVGFGKVLTASGSIGSVSGASPYDYRTGTPPTTASTLVYDTATLAYQAKRAGVTLRFRYSVEELTFALLATGAAPTGGVVLAFFRNSETNAFKWFRVLTNSGYANFYERSVQREFLDTALDANLNTYKVAILTSYDGTNRYAWTAGINRLFTIEELAN